MNSHVRDCIVEKYEYLIPTLTLPDPNDRHVLAAAIVGSADVIVTFNLKDFPESWSWSRQTNLGQAFQAPGVIFTPTDTVIPDVVWISKERLANGVDEAGHLTIAPELIVEVLSPGKLNEQRDKEVKLKLYSLHGVQEYWIVNWQQKTLEIYRRTDAQLQLVATLLDGDTLTSPLLQGFSAPIAQIFR
jgi:Uma2 family endonuclease